MTAAEGRRAVETKLVVHIILAAFHRIDSAKELQNMTEFQNEFSALLVGLPALSWLALTW